jgi:hypothetical protein
MLKVSKIIEENCMYEEYKIARSEWKRRLTAPALKTL